MAKSQNLNQFKRPKVSSEKDEKNRKRKDQKLKPKFTSNFPKKFPTIRT